MSCLLDGEAYEIIVVELRRPKPLENAVSTRDAAPQYVQIYDNSRMRSWRLMLEPGQVEGVSPPAVTATPGRSTQMAGWIIVGVLVLVAAGYIRKRQRTRAS